MSATKTLLAVDGRDLLELLADLRRTASSDSTMPMIYGVHLHITERAGATVLVGTSTNRYVLGQAHIPASGTMPEVFVPGDALDQILTIIRYSLRKATGLWEIRTDGQRVTISKAELGALATLTVSFDRRAERDFVQKTHSILSPKPADAASVQVTLDERWLSLFAQIAKSRKELLRIKLTGAHKQTVIQIGGRFRGVVMPVHADETPDVPIFTLPIDQDQEAAAA